MIRFEIKCTDCEESMRYCASTLTKENKMEWTCWSCGKQTITINLIEAILEQPYYSEEWL